MTNRLIGPRYQWREAIGRHSNASECQAKVPGSTFAAPVCQFVQRERKSFLIDR